MVLDANSVGVLLVQGIRRAWATPSPAAFTHTLLPALEENADGLLLSPWIFQKIPQPLGDQLRRTCLETHVLCFLYQILTFWYFLLEHCLGGVPFGSVRVFLCVQLISKTLNKPCYVSTTNNSTVLY